MSDSAIENGPTGNPIVAIKDVYKSFGDLKVIRGISLSIISGQSLSSKKEVLRSQNDFKSDSYGYCRQAVGIQRKYSTYKF